MRLMRIMVGLLLTAAVLFASAAALLLGTETGLRWSVQQLQIATGGELRIASVHGRLLGDIRLQGVDYRNRNIALSANRLALSWRPDSLLRGRIRITALNADQLQITPLSKKEPQQPFQGFSLPLPLHLEQAAVTGFRLNRTGDAAPIELDRIHFSGNYQNSTLTIRQMDADAPQGSVKAEGEIETTAQLAFDITAKWRWIAPPATIVSAAGTLHLRGNPKRYLFRTEVDLPVKKLPAARLEINGSGNLSGVQAEKLHASWLAGEWTGSGHLNWRPALSWSAKLSAEKLDPALAWERWPGGTISLQLSGRGDGSNNEVELEKLDGTIQKYPLNASGRLSLANGILHLDSVRIDSGSARLAVSGTVGTKWNTRWRLDAPDLAHLWPDMTGKLDASGKMTGPRKAPRFQLRLQGDGVGWKQYLTEQLRGDLNFGLQKDSAWLITGELDNIHIGENRLERFSFSGGGTTDGHRFQLRLERDRTTRLSSDIRGRLQNGVWHAVLENGHIALPGQQWRQQRRSELTLGRSVASLSSWCWRRESARLCIDGGKSGGGSWLADLSLQDFRLKWLQHWLPKEGFSLSGSADAAARLTYREGAIDGAHLALRLRDGKVGYMAPGNERYDTAYREIALQVEKNAAGVLATLDANLLQTGSARGRWQLPGWHSADPVAAAQPLDGELTITLNRLDLLPLFAPQIHQPAGKVMADLSFAGSVGAPQVNGVAKLANGSFMLPDLGLTLNEIMLQAEIRQNRKLLLRGSARSGPGTLAISGQADLESLHDWRTKLRLQGKDIEVARIPEAKVIATPDLTVNIQPRTVQISGYVDIPRAKIRLPEKQGVVPVSPDVVIVGAEREAAQQRKRWTIATSIALTLGEKIEVRGHGFEGRISGQLAIIESPNRPAIAQGELEIHDGSYKIYGQKITIDEGRLLYAASPLNNPGLQFRIVRKSRDVEAGMNVFGRLKKPELQLFSSPPMDDGDILAYLLIGKPLREASSSEGTRLSQAANSLQLAGGAWLAKRLGKELDIDEVTVESGTTEDETSLVLGKYLSPRLYVQYVIGLTEGGNILRARYEISEHWLLESESGRRSGVDLLFTMER